MQLPMKRIGTVPSLVIIFIQHIEAEDESFYNKYTKLTASSVCESYVAVLLAVHVSMHDITEMEFSRN